MLAEHCSPKERMHMRSSSKAVAMRWRRLQGLEEPQSSAWCQTSVMLRKEKLEVRKKRRNECCSECTNEDSDDEK